MQPSVHPFQPEINKGRWHKSWKRSKVQRFTAKGFKNVEFKSLEHVYDRIWVRAAYRKGSTIQAEAQVLRQVVQVDQVKVITGGGAVVSLFHDIDNHHGPVRFMIKLWWNLPRACFENDRLKVTHGCVHSTRWRSSFFHNLVQSFSPPSFHPSLASLMRPCIHSSIHFFIHACMHVRVRAFIPREAVDWFIHSFIHSFTHSFIHPSIHLSIHPSIHSFSFPHFSHPIHRNVIDHRIIKYGSNFYFI